MTAGNFTDNSAVPSAGRDGHGRWATGNAGRPAGSRGKYSKSMATAVGELGSKAISVLNHHLDNNSLKAAEIVISAILPKSRAIEFGEDFSPSTIEALLADGTINPNEGLLAANVLEKLTAVRNIDDLLARVVELEAALNERNNSR